MRSDVEIRPANTTDVVAYLGKLPESSFRGFVGDRSGEIVGMFGVYRDAGKLVAFSDYRDVGKRTIAMACRKMVELLDSVGEPVYAVADETKDKACYLLVKLGFLPTGMFCKIGEIMVRY